MPTGRRCFGLRAGQELTLTLKWCDHQVRAAVRVARVEREGMVRWILGLEFVEPTEQTREFLHRVASCATNFPMIAKV